MEQLYGAPVVFEEKTEDFVFRSIIDAVDQIYRIIMALIILLADGSRNYDLIK